MSETYWRQPRRWNKAAEAAGTRTRVFCGSMCDWAETLPGTHPSFAMMREARKELFALIEETPYLDWLLLTKRPENIMLLVPSSWVMHFPDNVWAGTSVEDQPSANQRVREILNVPARVRFLSCEPLIGGVDLEDDLAYEWVDHVGRTHCVPSVNWVICGGESGPGSRRMDPDWAHSLKSQCANAGVPFFFKQAGSVLAKEWKCSDSKGGKLDELPLDLRIREFPVSGMEVVPGMGVLQ